MKRGADGSVSGSSQTSASGPKGSYSAGTTTANGMTRHTTSATNATGDTYQGQTTYTKGQGVTHTGSCHDAQGNEIACH